MYLPPNARTNNIAIKYSKRVISELPAGILSVQINLTYSYFALLTIGQNDGSRKRGTCINDMDTIAIALVWDQSIAACQD